MEVLCDDTEKSGKPCLGIIVSHSENYDDIRVHEKPVVEYRYRQKWHQPAEFITAKSAIDRFLTNQGLSLLINVDEPELQDDGYQNTLF